MFCSFRSYETQNMSGDQPGRCYIHASVEAAQIDGTFAVQLASKCKNIITSTLHTEAQ